MALFDRNGEEKLREERREAQRRQEHLQQQQSLAQANGQTPDTRYLEKITDTKLDGATYNTIGQMLSQDFVLGNFTDAEAHEFRWLISLLQEKIEMMHPPEQSFVSGEDRKYYYDDEDDGLSPLSDKQKNDIHQILRLGVRARATRSRGGFQQEEFSKTVTVSEMRDDDDKKKGGWFS